MVVNSQNATSTAMRISSSPSSSPEADFNGRHLLCPLERQTLTGDD